MQRHVPSGAPGRNRRFAAFYRTSGSRALAQTAQAQRRNPAGRTRQLRHTHAHPSRTTSILLILYHGIPTLPGSLVWRRTAVWGVESAETSLMNEDVCTCIRAAGAARVHRYCIDSVESYRSGVLRWSLRGSLRRGAKTDETCWPAAWHQSMPKRKAQDPPPPLPSARPAKIRLDDTTSYPANTAVRIQGGEHAGASGQTIGFDSADGFYEVGLDKGGNGLVFLPRSSLLPRYAVVLIDLEGRADLNKYRGTVEGWDAERKRYEVILDADKSTVKLQPKNVLLPAGARICIQGLQGAAHYNGTLAKVTDFDADSGRYLVQYVDPAGELGVLKLKRENALLI